jgi:hypothetical protein
MPEVCGEELCESWTGEGCVCAALNNALSDLPLDEYGCPVVPEGATQAPSAPPRPCQLCHTHRPADGSPPWAWCRRMGTCAATIDWEAIARRDQC